MDGKAVRLGEFLRRLDAAEPFSTAEEAMARLGEILKAVEDEMTDIPFDPAMPRTDGRMYPPLPDSERAVAGRSDIKRYRSVLHNTYIGANGAIRIEELKGTCLLNKPGRDGLSIDGKQM
ncbi:hypothetical protein [Zavarzinia sp.]|uniref:hypothetical protein n=1 Tax=Zavarzinia sp. TaxID=2027920 RepID=UPI003BB6A0E8